MPDETKQLCPDFLIFIFGGFSSEIRTFILVVQNSFLETSSNCLQSSSFYKIWFGAWRPPRVATLVVYPNWPKITLQKHEQLLYWLGSDSRSLTRRLLAGGLRFWRSLAFLDHRHPKNECPFWEVEDDVVEKAGSGLDLVGTIVSTQQTFTAWAQQFCTFVC